MSCLSLSRPKNARVLAHIQEDPNASRTPSYTSDLYHHIFKSLRCTRSGLVAGTLILGTDKHNYGVLLEIRPRKREGKETYVSVQYAGAVLEFLLMEWSLSSAPPLQKLMDIQVTDDQRRLWPARFLGADDQENWLDVGLGLSTKARVIVQEESDDQFEPHFWLALLLDKVKKKDLLHHCKKDQAWFQALMREVQAGSGYGNMDAHQRIKNLKRKIILPRPYIDLECRILNPGTGLSRDLLTRWQQETGTNGFCPSEWIRKKMMCLDEREAFRQVFALSGWSALCRGIPETLSSALTQEVPEDAKQVLWMDMTTGEVDLSDQGGGARHQRAAKQVVVVGRNPKNLVLCLFATPPARSWLQSTSFKETKSRKRPAETLDEFFDSSPSSLSHSVETPFQPLNREKTVVQTSKNPRLIQALGRFFPDVLCRIIEDYWQTALVSQAKAKPKSKAKSKAKPKSKKRGASQFVDLEAEGGDTASEDEHEEDGTSRIDDNGYEKDDFVVSDHEEEQDAKDSLLATDPLFQDQVLQEEQVIHARVRSIQAKHGSNVQVPAPKHKARITPVRDPWRSWFQVAWATRQHMCSIPVDSVLSDLFPHQLLYQLHRCILESFPEEAVCVAHALLLFPNPIFLVAENRSTDGLTVLVDALADLCTTTVLHPALGTLLLWGVVRKKTGFTRMDAKMQVMALQIVHDLAFFRARIDFRMDPVRKSDFSLDRLESILLGDQPIQSILQLNLVALATQILYSTYDRCQGLCDAHVSGGSIGWTILSEVIRQLDPAAVPSPPPHPPPGAGTDTVALHPTCALLNALVRLSKRQDRHEASRHWFDLFRCGGSKPKTKSKQPTDTLDLDFCSLVPGEDVMRRIDTLSHPDPLLHRSILPLLLLYFPGFRQALEESARTCFRSGNWNHISARLTRVVSLYANGNNWMENQSCSSSSVSLSQEITKIMAEEARPQPRSLKRRRLQSVGETRQGVVSPVQTLAHANLSSLDFCLYVLIQASELHSLSQSTKLNVAQSSSHSPLIEKLNSMSLPRPELWTRPSRDQIEDVQQWFHLFSELLMRHSDWSEHLAASSSPSSRSLSSSSSVSLKRHIRGGSRAPWIERLLENYDRSPPWEYVLLPPFLLALQFPWVGDPPTSEQEVISEDPRRFQYRESSIWPSSNFSCHRTTWHSAPEPERNRIHRQGHGMWIQRWVRVDEVAWNLSLQTEEEATGDDAPVVTQQRRLKQDVLGWIHMDRKECKFLYLDSATHDTRLIRLSFAEIKTLLVSVVRMGQLKAQAETLLDEPWWVREEEQEEKDQGQWWARSSVADFFASIPFRTEYKERHAWYDMSVALLAAVLQAVRSMAIDIQEEVWPESWFSEMDHLSLKRLSRRYPLRAALLESQDPAGEIDMGNMDGGEDDASEPGTTWIQGEHPGVFYLAHEIHPLSSLPRDVLTHCQSSALTRHQTTSNFKTSHIQGQELLHDLVRALIRSLSCDQERREWILCFMLSAWVGAVQNRQQQQQQQQRASFLLDSHRIFLPAFFGWSAAPSRSQAIHVLCEHGFAVLDQKKGQASVLRTAQGIGSMELVALALELKSRPWNSADATLPILNPMTFAWKFVRDWMETSPSEPRFIRRGLHCLRQKLLASLRDPERGLSFAYESSHPDPVWYQDGEKLVYVNAGLQSVAESRSRSRSTSEGGDGSAWSRSRDLCHAQHLVWLLGCCLDVLVPTDWTLGQWSYVPGTGSLTIWKWIHICDALSRMQSGQTVVVPERSIASLLPVAIRKQWNISSSSSRSSTSDPSSSSRSSSSLSSVPVSSSSSSSSSSSRSSSSLSSVPVSSSSSSSSRSVPSSSSHRFTSSLSSTQSSSSSSLSSSCDGRVQQEKKWFIVDPPSIESWLEKHTLSKSVLVVTDLPARSRHLLNWISWTDWLSSSSSSERKSTQVLFHLSDLWMLDSVSKTKPELLLDQARQIAQVQAPVIWIVSGLPRLREKALLRLFQTMDFWPYYDSTWVDLFSAPGSKLPACAQLTAMEHACDWTSYVFPLPPTLPRALVLRSTRSLGSWLRQRYCSCDRSQEEKDQGGTEEDEEEESREAQEWAQKLLPEKTPSEITSFLVHKVWPIRTDKRAMRTVLFGHLKQTERLVEQKVVWLSRATRSRWLRELDQRCSCILTQERKTRLVTALDILLPRSWLEPDTTVWTRSILQLKALGVEGRDRDHWITESEMRLKKQKCNLWSVSLPALCKQILDLCQECSDPYCSWKPEWCGSSQEKPLRDHGTLFYRCVTPLQEQERIQRQVACPRGCIQTQVWSILDPNHPIFQSAPSSSARAQKPPPSQLILCEPRLVSPQDLGVLMTQPWTLVEMAS